MGGADGGVDGGVVGGGEDGGVVLPPVNEGGRPTVTGYKYIPSSQLMHLNIGTV